MMRSAGVGVGVSAAVLYGIFAQPGAVSMAVGLMCYLAGCIWRVIVLAWENSVVESPLKPNSFSESFHYPQAATTVIMVGPYKWMRAPRQVAHIMMSCGLAMTTGHFWLFIIVLLLSFGCFGLQFVISEQNAQLAVGDDEAYQQYLRTTPVVSFRLFSWQNLVHLNEISFEHIYGVVKQEISGLVACIGVVVFICLFK